MVLGRIFGPKQVEVMGEGRTVHSGELHICTHHGTY
jgi:hypothetical protein